MHFKKCKKKFFLQSSNNYSGLGFINKTENSVERMVISAGVSVEQDEIYGIGPREVIGIC